MIFQAGKTHNRKQTEENLRESEQRYRSLVEDMPALICRFNPDGILTFVNNTYCQYFNKKKGDLVGFNFFEFIPEDDREATITHLKSLTTEQPEKSYEHQVYSPSGELRWQRWTDRAFFDQQGQVIEYQSVGQDITDRKHAEETLKEQERLLRRIAENYPNSYLSIIEKDYTIGFTAGKEFTKAKLDPNQFVNLTIEEVFEDQTAFVQEHFEETFRGREQSFELFINDQHQLYHTVPLPAKDGSIPRILSVAENITERKQREIELQQAKETAETANRAKGAFLAKVSHELRTPLNSILGFTELLATYPTLTPEQQEMMSIVVSSGEHLLALVNDILNFSKIEAGHKELNLEECHLPSFLRGLEEMFFLRATKKGLTLSFERSSDIPQVILTDPVKLQQILINILGNAIKFTDKGHVIMCVDVNAASSQKSDQQNKTRSLQFTIKDTGKGIPEDEIDAIFIPFAQSDPTDPLTEGVGLGLSISQEYAKLMGGDISVESQIGKGTTFRLDILVEVPRRQKTSPKSFQENKSIIGLKANQPKYRLLLVEDFDDNLRLLIYILQPLGFDLRTACNGKEAIEIWKEWLPDAILMDIQMPVMSGLEAIKEIKALPKGDETIFIAMAAGYLREDRHEILNVAGFDEFIPKPFRRQEILNALATHLGVEYECQESQSNIAQTLDSQNIDDLRSKYSLSSDKQKHVFTRAIIHDLKNPLSTIVGCADLLVTDRKRMPEETTEKIINEILSSCNKLNNLLEKLADSSTPNTDHSLDSP